MAVLPGGCVAAFFVLSLAWTSLASADLLLESRVGPVRAQDAPILEAFRRAVEQLNASGKTKVRVRPGEVLEALGQRVPRDGHFDRGLTSRQLFDQLADAYQAYTQGEYQLAEQQLENALALAHQNPTLVVAHSESRELLTRALIGMALARSRLGDSSGSFEALAEQLRSFPELPATEDEYGPEGYRLYENARKRIDRQRRGSLIIEVRNPDARIFINEFGRGRGGIFSGELVPGSYRVLVEIGPLGRVYDVEVRPSEQTRLRIDWPTDSAFVATKDWIGFSLPAVDGSGISRYAGELARKLQVEDVLVLAMSWSGARRYLSAARFSMKTGKKMQSGSVELDVGPAGNATKIRALAEHMVLDQRSELILPLVWEVAPPQLKAAVVPPPPARRDEGPSMLTLSLGGTAVVALLAGGGLLYLDETEECGVDDRFCVPFGSAELWEISFFSLGMFAATGATISYLIDRDDDVRDQALSVRIRPSGASATLGWTF